MGMWESDWVSLWVGTDPGRGEPVLNLVRRRAAVPTIGCSAREMRAPVASRRAMGDGIGLRASAA